MSLGRLADELIARRCGTHSLGLVYEFLLKTYGDPKRARADFLRFLSGELPTRLLREAQFWVAEEQGALPSINDDDALTATECPGTLPLFHRPKARPSMRMKKVAPAGNQHQVHPTKFESKELLFCYAEQYGLAALLEKFARWERVLSPNQYSLVEVRTTQGLRPAMLLPKEILKAAWKADPFRKMLLTGDSKREGQARANAPALRTAPNADEHPHTSCPPRRCLLLL
jgi:hypothetical protein